MDASKFPMLVALTDTESKILETPHDIPAGVHLKILETNVGEAPAKKGKIINTGYAKVAAGAD